MTEITEQELLDWAIKNKRVDILVKHKWGYDLSPKQVALVKKIAYLESRKLSISAMTRWGKSRCVSLGIALLIDFGVSAKIAFLGPKQEQADILRQYLSELILTDPSLLSKAQISVTGKERLGKEASRRRMTFTTGAEYRVFSGEGEADRLMGFGCVPPDAEILTNKGVMTAEQVWKTNMGLLIYSFNHDKQICEFQKIKHRVKNPAKKLIKIVNTSGTMIVTDNHPVYVVKKGYIEARDVSVNDRLLKCNCNTINYGSDKMLSMRKHNKQATKSYCKSQLQERDVEEVIVRRIEELPAGKETYNFEVDQNHNYFVNGILTHNCDILIRDEACLINRNAYTKSSRMLGDDPENSVEIELYNPWKRDNLAFEHTLDPEWEVIHIGWREAVAEGRTTEKFVMDQKKTLRPLDFIVLYESKFPEQGEDSLFSLSWIEQAEKSNFGLLKKQNNLLQQLKDIEKDRTKLSEHEYRTQKAEIKEELGKFRNIISCDPAEQGLDETVIFWGIEYKNRYEVVGYYSEAKSEPMRVVGKIVDIALQFIPQEIKGQVNIDRIGIGSGPFGRLKEVIRTEKGWKHIKVQGCHYGEKAIKSDEFQNKKAENFFRLAAIMQEGMISIPVLEKLRKQLTAESWERTSSNKKKVIDPEDKSPDWADGLVYLTWKDKNKLIWSV